MSSQSSTQWRGERYTHNHTDQTHTHPPPISRFSCGLFSSLFSFLSYDYWVSFFLWFIAQELDVQRLGNFFALFSVLLLLFGWVILIGTYCWCQFGCCSVEFLVGWGFWIPVFFLKWIVCRWNWSCYCLFHQTNGSFWLGISLIGIFKLYVYSNKWVLFLFIVSFADLWFVIASLCGSRQQSLRSGCLCGVCQFS